MVFKRYPMACDELMTIPRIAKEFQSAKGPRGLFLGALGKAVAKT